jgi:hypothetical protein
MVWVCVNVDVDVVVVVVVFGSFELEARLAIRDGLCVGSFDRGLGGSVRRWAGAMMALAPPPRRLVALVNNSLSTTTCT